VNDILTVFLNSIFAENIVFISFLGILLLYKEARGLRTSFKKGLKFSAALLISILLGWVLAGWLPENDFLLLWVFWLTGIIGIFVLYSWNELRGSWLNLPRIIIALPLFTGSQWIIQHQNVEYFERIYPILGTVIGFYLAFVLTAGVREQIKISEIPGYLKEKPLLLIAISFFALALIGFNFL